MNTFHFNHLLWFISCLFRGEGFVMNTDCSAFSLVLSWCHSISPESSFLQKLLNQNRSTICFQQQLFLGPPEQTEHLWKLNKRSGTLPLDDANKWDASQKNKVNPGWTSRSSGDGESAMIWSGSAALTIRVNLWGVTGFKSTSCLLHQWDARSSFQGSQNA